MKPHAERDNLVDRVHNAAKAYGLEIEIVDLFKKVMNDERPPLRCVYVFAETKDNQESSFRAANEMKKQCLAARFYIPDGTQTNIGYPGFEKWSAELSKFVGRESVLRMPVRINDRLDTQAEASSLIQLAAEIKQEQFYAVAPPFHMLRAYMTAASEVIMQSSPLSLFSYPGAEQPLDERVAHSQGTDFATRREFFGLEVKKIRDIRISYHNILTAKEILDYMAKRVVPPQPPQPLNSGASAR